MSLFEYFKEVADTKIPVESDTFARIIQSDDYVAPHKIIRMDPGMIPGQIRQGPRVSM